MVFDHGVRHLRESQTKIQHRFCRVSSRESRRLEDALGVATFHDVELGAGTGKFTRAVLSVLEKRAVKNVKIISTEPIKEMCEKFKEMVPNNEILQRRADNLVKFLMVYHFTGMVW